MGTQEAHGFEVFRGGRARTISGLHKWRLYLIPNLRKHQASDQAGFGVTFQVVPELQLGGPGQTQDSWMVYTQAHLALTHALQALPSPPHLSAGKGTH